MQCSPPRHKRESYLGVACSHIKAFGPLSLPTSKKNLHRSKACDMLLLHWGEHWNGSNTWRTVHYSRLYVCENPCFFTLYSVHAWWLGPVCTETLKLELIRAVDNAKRACILTNTHTHTHSQQHTHIVSTGQEKPTHLVRIWSRQRKASNGVSQLLQKLCINWDKRVVRDIISLLITRCHKLRPTHQKFATEIIMQVAKVLIIRHSVVYRSVSV